MRGKAGKSKTAVSWSGGKDSILACHKAMARGHQVVCLINSVSKRYGRVSFHGVRRELVALQARALGVSILQPRVTRTNYEQEFKKALKGLREEGIKTAVFGDIHLQDHRDWVERVCRLSRINPVLPLWKIETDAVLAELVKSGFEAYVVSTQASKLGKEWVGRRIDREFISDIKKVRKKSNIDICGEAGEYHTFVVDGPIFKKRIELLRTRKVFIRGYWFLDIKDYKLVEKSAII
jgi:diphthine-ammonia ligase